MQTDYTTTDRRFINPTTLSAYCNTNAHLLTATPRAFVLEFPGLGGGSCLGGCMEQGPYNSSLAGFLAEHGILLAYLFPGPWSWMNRGAVRMVDAVVDALREQYGLTETTPWMVMGGSMGGQSALIYGATHRNHPTYTPTACISHCPCVDVLDRYACAPSVPRSLFRAVADYDMPIEEALQTISPVCRLADMPPIPYHIINDLADELFPPEQMDAYVESLRRLGHTVTYHRLENCRHGELTASEWEYIRTYLLQHLV